MKKALALTMALALTFGLSFSSTTFAGMTSELSPNNDNDEDIICEIDHSQDDEDIVYEIDHSQDDGASSDIDTVYDNYEYHYETDVLLLLEQIPAAELEAAFFEYMEEYCPVIYSSTKTRH